MVKYLGTAKQDISDFTTYDPNSDEHILEKLDIGLLVPGQYQPRKIISEEALNELALSIKAQGVIQPVVVRLIEESKYEILAGERRWRAAKIAGLSEVPCLIRNIPDDAAIAISLIENIQREDLNAVEEAFALKRLMDEFELTHDQAADAVGKKRTTVTNLLRLLKLSEPILKMVMNNELEAGAARALVGLNEKDAIKIANKASDGQLTVRQVEKQVSKIRTDSFTKKETSVEQSKDIIRIINGLAKLGINTTSEQKRGRRNLFKFEKLDGELADLAELVEKLASILDADSE